MQGTKASEPLNAPYISTIQIHNTINSRALHIRQVLDNGFTLDMYLHSVAKSTCGEDA
jgi:hypothetical protein